MHLDVRLYLQKEDSRDCGAICLKMLLAYHGREVAYDTIASAFVHVQSGTTVPQLGSYLLGQGFDTDIITLNPHMFSHDMLGLTDQEAIRRHLANRKPNLKTDDRKTVAQHMIDYMDNGGTYRLKIPDVADMRAELADGRPLIAILTTRYLHGGCGFNFHFNVVTGLDDTHVHVNDPLWNDEGLGQYKIPVEAFFYAMHAAAFGDLDNDSLLLVRPRG